MTKLILLFLKIINGVFRKSCGDRYLSKQNINGIDLFHPSVTSLGNSHNYIQFKHKISRNIHHHIQFRANISDITHPECMQ